MLTELEKVRYSEACVQTDAIFALEGFAPTEQSKILDQAILAGKVTPAQVKQEMVNYVNLHKTIDGFAASRAWI